MENRIEPPVPIILALFLLAMGVGFAALYGLGAWALSQAIGPFIPIVIWAISSVLTWMLILGLRRKN